MDHSGNTRHFADLHTALTWLERAYTTVGPVTLYDIEKRLASFSHVALTDRLGNYALQQFEAGRCAYAVNHALDQSNVLMGKMVAEQFAGLDFSTVWRELLDMATEAALYIGGGAVIGGAIGGAIGAAAAVAGAAPGAALGAAAGVKLVGVVMTAMGMADLLEHLVAVG